MRKDLTDRLRAIVRQIPVRELTYEPETTSGVVFQTPTPDVVSGIAEALGGRAVVDGSASLIVIDRVFDATCSHGRWPIARSRPLADAPLSLFDARAGAVPGWATRPLFFDTETTGLSGGAGTIAFLAGLGWFEDGGFRVRQWLLTGQASERLLLRELSAALDDASLLVSYNGRTFDVPLMEMRWAFHRQPSPFDELPHFDMLPAARRLWSRRETAVEGGDASCSLSTLERDVLGFHRQGDVPGFEIPVRYFQFLRTGDHRLLDGVLDHHRHDIVSLAVLMAHALRMAGDGPDLCRDDHEVVALGGVFERAGLTERAVEAFERASCSADRYVRAHACTRLGLMHRRAGRHDEAARAWAAVVEAAGGRRSLVALERAATEALAIHHEHRAGDLDAAKKFAESMRAQATGRAAAEARHRLARLERKLTGQKKRGGTNAAPLLE